MHLLSYFFRSLLILLLVAPAWPQNHAPSKDTKDLGVGKFLVASRDLRDPNFARTVIILVQYGQSGTVGLAINHRTEVSVSEALAEMGTPARNHPDPVFIGGPVEAEEVRALIRKRPAPELAQHVLNDVYMIWQRKGLERELKSKANAAVFRIYLGYCGWGKGQLENEIRTGSWYVFDAAALGSKQDVFDADPGTLWNRLIEKTERRIAYTVQKMGPPATCPHFLSFSLPQSGQPLRRQYASLS